MANVLALDQASKVSGYAIFQDGKFVKCGIIKATASWPLGKRLVYIADNIEKLIKEYNIDEIVCEDVILEEQDKNTIGFKTFKALAEVLGVVVQIAYRNNKPIEIISANEWRRKLGIRTGRGQKREIVKAADIAFVHKTLGISPTEDECDAVCIGYAYLNNEIPSSIWG